MTKSEKTLALLHRMWLTPLESAARGGCLSLSQRVGGWERQGIKFERKEIRANGSRFLAYRVAKG